MLTWVRYVGTNAVHSIQCTFCRGVISVSQQYKLRLQEVIKLLFGQLQKLCHPQHYSIWGTTLSPNSEKSVAHFDKHRHNKTQIEKRIWHTDRQIDSDQRQTDKVETQTDRQIDLFYWAPTLKLHSHEVKFWQHTTTVLHAFYIKRQTDRTPGLATPISALFPR